MLAHIVDKQRSAGIHFVIAYFPHQYCYFHHDFLLTRCFLYFDDLDAYYVAWLTLDLALSASNLINGDAIALDGSYSSLFETRSMRLSASYIAILRKVCSRCLRSQNQTWQRSVAELVPDRVRDIFSLSGVGTSREKGCTSA